MRAPVVESDREQTSRVGECLPNDPGGRAADGVVATVEARFGAVEVGDHDLNRNRRGRYASGGDRSTGEPAASPDRVPDPQARDHERDFLARQGCECREAGKRQQPILVQIPDRKEQQRTGEGNRVELVQCHPLGRREEQVGE